MNCLGLLIMFAMIVVAIILFAFVLGVGFYLLGPILNQFVR